VLAKLEAKRELPFILQSPQVHLAISNAECLQSLMVYDFLASHNELLVKGAVMTARLTAEPGI
jgi:hypothetical protein